MSGLSIAAYFPFTRMKITEQHVHHEDASSAMIFLAPDQRFRALCHECGHPALTTHSWTRREVQDLSLAQARVWLQIEYRKIWCPACNGVRVEDLDFCDAGKRVTHRLARYIHQLCKLMTIKDVAELVDVDPRTVKEIDKTFLEEQFGANNYDGVRILMIDEIAVRKGHRYLTVVADYLTGRVLWMGQGRSKETLDAFFATMTDEQKQAIEAAVSDMWDPYINRLKHHLPQAKLVFDFFHVVQNFGKVIDKVRRMEYARANSQERPLLVGSKYLLLKNAENLTEEQRHRLADLLAVNQTLAAAYLLKDQLKLLFFYDDADRVRQALEDWCAMAAELDHPVVTKFVATLQNYAYGIINHADFPIETSRLEGINHKIKNIHRRAFGYQDDQYFILKVKQATQPENHQLFCS